MTALEPVLRANEGAWIGWPGSTGDDLDPFEQDGLHLVPMTLSDQEVEYFYEGFSNGTLWPLYHDVVAKPEFHRDWWIDYVKVNQRFAEKAAEIASEGALVWVQDYQMQLVPQMLRELRPDLRIGFFLHIPFPAGRAVPAAPVAAPDPGGAARGRPGRLPAGRRRSELRAPGAAARRAQDPPRHGLPPRRAHGAGEGVPDLDRHSRLPEAGRVGLGGRARRRDPHRARQPAHDLPRHRPPRLHEGHLRPPARLQRAGARRLLRRRGHRVRAGGDALSRARRAVPHAARRHRPAGRPDQRRPGPDRQAGDLLPALVLPPATRWPRSTAPPTSWWSRRCATG